MLPRSFLRRLAWFKARKKAYNCVLDWRGVRTNSASPWCLQHEVHPLDLVVGPRGRLGYDLAYPHHFERSRNAL